MLEPDTDQGALETLVDAQTARLLVVDYAETRAEQLELVLPLLAAHGRAEHPVRVLLLVRGRPRDSDDWKGLLRRGCSDELDALLDDADQIALDELPVDQRERNCLFDLAARALAERSRDPTAVPAVPAILKHALFAGPLMVVIAAYLAVQGEDVPTTRGELLDDLLIHEDRDWQRSARGLLDDGVLRRRVVAFATLAGADDDPGAAAALRVIPDLRDASTERLGAVARWAAGLYPGPRYWNALEPDLLGEHLVATTYSDSRDVLRALQHCERPLASMRVAAAAA